MVENLAQLRALFCLLQFVCLFLQRRQQANKFENLCSLNTASCKPGATIGGCLPAFVLNGDNGSSHLSASASTLACASPGTHYPSFYGRLTEFLAVRKQCSTTTHLPCSQHPSYLPYFSVSSLPRGWLTEELSFHVIWFCWFSLVWGPSLAGL